MGVDSILMRMCHCRIYGNTEDVLASLFTVNNGVTYPYTCQLMGKFLLNGFSWASSPGGLIYFDVSGSLKLQQCHCQDA